MNPRVFQEDLLAWYDVHARTLPWRSPPDQRADPYAVWLSEIMLQQTTVATVGPYFRHFLERWPTVEALATAPLDDILAAWAGLGYYSRARNLHSCAQAVCANFGGRFPGTEAELLTLPGIGPYTAAAIAAIAFNRPAVVVDGNVDRVMTRLHNSPLPIRENKPAIHAWAKTLTPSERPGDYAQALMDLGATICRPTGPQCLLCPVSAHCAAKAEGTASDLPTKPKKTAKPTRVGHAYLIQDGAKLLIDKRPAKGLLGGMDGLPTHEWGEVLPPLLPQARALDLEVRHTFTHFHLVLTLAEGPPDLAAHFPTARFVQDLSQLALPTLFKKALKAASHL